MIMTHGALVTRLYPVARWSQEVIQINSIYMWLYFRDSYGIFILCNLKIHRLKKNYILATSTLSVSDIYFWLIGCYFTQIWSAATDAAMPNVMMFREFKFSNGAPNPNPKLLIFLNLILITFFRMRAVSTCWRTSLINIRMTGMADLLPSYGVFFKINKYARFTAR